MTKRVLVLAPHPDDETIGCGGVLCRHVDEGHEVEVAFFTSGELGVAGLPPAHAWQLREGEAHNACAALGIRALSFLRLPDWGLAHRSDSVLEALTPLIERIRPTFMYAPHKDESHPDHSAVLMLTLEACRRVGLTNAQIFAYEIWSPLKTCDAVIDITPYLDRKLKALESYASQLSDRDYASAVRGLGMYRAALWKCGKYAEAFGRIDL